MARPKGSNGTKQLTSDDRLRIRTLYYDAMKSKKDIEAITGFTEYQIRGAIRAPNHQVQPRSGRPPVLSEAQVTELTDFVRASKENRRMSFLQLSLVLFQGLFGMWTIKKTLYRLGYRRRVARKKPPISEKNRKLRLAWAIEHKDWSFEQWASILWTDETWVTGGPHTKQYVTRLPGEEWDPTCIVEKHQRKHGWMFWGSFSGTTKGPGIFWEKDWGSIGKDTYQERIIPVICGWIRLMRKNGTELILMQDGAPGHTAQDTQKDLCDRGITVIQWPPYSPDLNPIESCWNWMKDFIQDKYGLDEKPGYDKLRSYVVEAWNELPESYMEELLRSMHLRCEAVIKANGMHTQY